MSIAKENSNPDNKKDKKTDVPSARSMNFERTILKLAESFINTPLEKIESSINDAIGLIGHYCGADRIAIFLFDWEKENACLRNEWVKKEEYSTQQEYKTVPFSKILPQIMERHKKSLPHTINKNKHTLQYKDYYDYFKKSGAQILTFVPLIMGEEVLGTCVLTRITDDKEWTTVSISMIKIFCEMLTSVLIKIKNEQTLLETNEILRLLLDSTYEGIGMLDQEGNILSVNSEFARRFGKEPPDIIGVNFQELIPRSKYGDLFEQRRKKINRVFDTEQPEFF